MDKEKLQIYIKSYEIAALIQGPAGKQVTTESAQGIIAHYIPLSIDLYKYFLEVDPRRFGK